MSPALCTFHQAVQPLSAPFASLYLQTNQQTGSAESWQWRSDKTDNEDRFKADKEMENTHLHTVDFWPAERNRKS